MDRSMAENRWVKHQLATSSPRVIGLLTGGFFGVVMTIFAGVTQGQWPGALIGGTAGGVLFGAVMGPLMSRLNHRVLGDLRQLRDVDLQIIVRASNRGPVPTDSGTRAAALELARRRHTETIRTRRQSLVLFVVLLALTTGLAVTQSAWWSVGVALWLAALLMLVIVPRRQRRRIELLGG